jgi:hypothetical protein
MRYFQPPQLGKPGYGRQRCQTPPLHPTPRRQCVLPVLLVSVLPAARRLRPYLLQLMGSAHELRQRWLMEALPVGGCTGSV